MLEDNDHCRQIVNPWVMTTSDYVLIESSANFDRKSKEIVKEERETAEPESLVPGLPPRLHSPRVSKWLLCCIFEMLRKCLLSSCSH